MKTRCPNANAEGCPYANRCYADTDHIYWPRSDYRTKTEREFRELPENKRQLCRWEHDERHATEEPPEKPTREQMIQAITRTMIQEAS